jgi:hypothetical protein
MVTKNQETQINANTINEFSNTTVSITIIQMQCNQKNVNAIKLAVIQNKVEQYAME